MRAHPLDFRACLPSGRRLWFRVSPGGSSMSLRGQTMGRWVLVAVMVSGLGCTKYHRGGVSQPSMPSPYASRGESGSISPSNRGGRELPSPRSTLTMPPPSPVGSRPAGLGTESTELSLVPPLPREPMPKDFVVTPPQSPGPGSGLATRPSSGLATDANVTPVSARSQPSAGSTGSPPPLHPGTVNNTQHESGVDFASSHSGSPASPSPSAEAVAIQPGKLEKDPRPEPQPAAMPSPFAPSAGGGEAGVANIEKLQSLAAKGLERWRQISTYEARLTRREVVGGKPQNEEQMLYRVRREPFAIYMKNLGPHGKGREVLYNPSQHGDKLHIIVGEGDSFFLKAGSRAPSMSPDNRSVMEKSRHSIRDAGFGNSLNRFQTVLDKVKSGRAKPDTLIYVGPESRPQDLPGLTLERVDQTIHPGDDPLVPRGGKRHWFFDAKPDSPSYAMPVLVITYEAGREVEYYRFDQFRIPAGLTDADFHPDNMGKKK